jgi:hypothetical protein
MKPSRWLAFANILVASVRRLVTTSATEGAAGDETPTLENFVKYAGADKPDGFGVTCSAMMACRRGEDRGEGQWRQRRDPQNDPRRVGQDFERLFAAEVGTFECAKKNVVHVKLDVYGSGRPGGPGTMVRMVAPGSRSVTEFRI